MTRTTPGDIARTADLCMPPSSPYIYQRRLPLLHTHKPESFDFNNVVTTCLLHARPPGPRSTPRCGTVGTPASCCTTVQCSSSRTSGHKVWMWDAAAGTGRAGSACGLAHRPLAAADAPAVVNLPEGPAASGPAAGEGTLPATQSLCISTWVSISMPSCRG